MGGPTATGLVSTTRSELTATVDELVGPTPPGDTARILTSTAHSPFDEPQVRFSLSPVPSHPTPLRRQLLGRPGQTGFPRPWPHPADLSPRPLAENIHLPQVRGPARSRSGARPYPRQSWARKKMLRQAPTHGERLTTPAEQRLLELPSDSGLGPEKPWTRSAILRPVLDFRLLTKRNRTHTTVDTPCAASAWKRTVCHSKNPRGVTPQLCPLPWCPSRHGPLLACGF